MRRAVGQDELEVTQLADTTLVVMAPGLGDDIQAIKAGILEVDEGAEVVKLDELGIADDTIVVWAGDNGSGATKGEAMGAGGYWKGCFGGSWEGSYRSPAMIRWPGKIPAGRTSDAIFATIDFMPTFATLCGFEPPDDRRDFAQAGPGGTRGCGHEGRRSQEPR